MALPGEMLVFGDARVRDLFGGIVDDRDRLKLLGIDRQ